MNSTDIIYDVVCLGAGISGLYTIKYMKSEGLSVVALEKEDDFGGVWRYKDSPGGVIKSTITTSSRTVTDSTDFFIKSKTHFPTHEEMLSYIREYAKFFNLIDHIELNSEVIHAEKIENIWNVTDVKGRVWKGKNFVVASGANNIPNIPEVFREKFKNFTGKMIHSSVYKEPTPEYKNKTVLMVGGGETSADIGTELSYITKDIYLSISNGQWFGERTGGFLYRFPLEHFSSRLRRWIINGDKNPELFWVIKAGTEVKSGFQGHGIECWRTPFDAYATSFINKNTAILERIKEGKAHPKAAIDRTEDKTVYFKDGTQVDFDIVMFCTGYNLNFDWLKFPKPTKSGFCFSKLYKMFIYPEDPSLAFIGFVRPVRGSIPSGCEMQAWMYSHYLAGKIKLPSYDEMVEIAKEEKKERDNHFGEANSRIVTLTPVYEYCDDIARIIGVYPNYGELFRKVGLRKFWNILRAPFHMSHYRLQTDEDIEYHLNMIDRFIPYTPMNIIAAAIVGRILYTGKVLFPITIVSLGFISPFLFPRIFKE